MAICRAKNRVIQDSNLKCASSLMIDLRWNLHNGILIASRINRTKQMQDNICQSTNNGKERITKFTTFHHLCTMFDHFTRCHAQRSSLSLAQPSCPLAYACYHSEGPIPPVCRVLFCTRNCHIVGASFVAFQAN